MPYYKVKTQPIYYNGATYYPGKKVGEKEIPADVVEMTEDEAKAYGKNYLEKVQAPKEKKEKKEEKEETEETKEKETKEKEEKKKTK